MANEEPVPMMEQEVGDNFEEVLVAQIKSSPERKKLGQRLLTRIFERPKSRLRTRMVNRLRAHAIAELKNQGVDASAVGFDWSTVDWAKLFDTLLKIFLAILPFLAL